MKLSQKQYRMQQIAQSRAEAAKRAVGRAINGTGNPKYAITRMKENGRKLLEAVQDSGFRRMYPRKAGKIKGKAMVIDLISRGRMCLESASWAIYEDLMPTDISAIAYWRMVEAGESKAVVNWGGELWTLEVTEVEDLQPEGWTREAFLDMVVRTNETR